ncbi:2-methylaconitate cis-trans isomerase PrpF family protein [Halorubrum sp. HHNYT27]|uniref:2-methylaconitate cis-trans isomerase PrpF family protein n=1 Tax=Halorubrum sp. HHNYT27 TaxID=3402275 RepID=UPI003EB9B359
MSNASTPTGQGSVPGVLFRGGTSKGFFVRDGVLPEPGALRDELILELFGSPDPLQVDGIGGSKSHTSKLMIVGPADREDVDVAYTFGQVAVEDPVVDWGGNCGNLTAAVGAFAVHQGIVDAESPAADLTLINTNTDTVIDQTVPVTSRGFDVYGDYAIDGVPGTGARIPSRFRDPAGSVTGALFPTGTPTEQIALEGGGRNGGDRSIPCSVADVGNPCVFLRASDLELDGTELPAELTETPGLLDELERIRGVVCERIGLLDDASRSRSESPAVPQIAVVSEPQSYDTSVGTHVSAAEIDITARIVTSGTPHHAYAVTGALCLAATASLPGTVPNEVVRRGTDGSVTIGHPKGTIEIGVEVGEEETRDTRDGDDDGPDPTIEAVTVGRTARPLFTGEAQYRYVGELSHLDPDLAE